MAEGTSPRFLRNFVGPVLLATFSVAIAMAVLILAVAIAFAG